MKLSYADTAESIYIVLFSLEISKLISSLLNFLYSILSFFSFNFMCMCVLPECISVNLEPGGALRSQKRVADSWDWSDR